MRYLSYVVARDYGFAPNPFHGVCTLATCKPDIRNTAKINDWIIGSGSVGMGLRGFLIYAMKITEKLTYEEYFQSERFQRKKPILNGSLKQTYGDNIYTKDSSNSWCQLDSHHSNQDGSINYYNLNRDTKSPYVLISENFYYFGRKAIQLPNDLQPTLYKYRGFKYIDPSYGDQLMHYLETYYERGLLGLPVQFKTFKRYDGKS